jgi:hypothetical protein
LTEAIQESEIFDTKPHHHNNIKCGSGYYKRNGATTLFAALEVLRGKVIGQCDAQPRHQEFLKFLRHLD